MIEKHPKRVYELDFTLRHATGYFVCHNASVLNVSDNGQYMVLSNAEHIYRFNCHQPDLGWMKIDFPELSQNVYPTDSGGYWVAHEEQIIRFNHQHERQQQFVMGSFDRIWGNDDWLLVHDQPILKFVRLDNQPVVTMALKEVILHAWLSDTGIRLLSVDKHKRRLALWEWNLNAGTLNVLDVWKKELKLGIIGLTADYYQLGNSHAWPLSNGARVIKLLPGSVIVTAEGKIQASDDKMVFHAFEEQRISFCDSKWIRLVLAVLGRQFSRSSLGYSDPFPIALCESENAIHVLTTKNHTIIAKADMDSFVATHIAQSFEDSDQVEWLLEHCEDSVALDLADDLTDSLLYMLDRQRCDAEEYAIVTHRQALLHPYFKRAFPGLFQRLLQCDNDYERNQTLVKLVSLIAAWPYLKDTFFSTLDDFSEQQKMCAVLKNVLVICPKKIQTMFPQTLLAALPSVSALLQTASEPEKRFFLETMPLSLMSNTGLMSVLENNGDFEIWELVFSRFDKKLKSLCAHAVLSKRFEKTLSHAQFSSQQKATLYGVLLEKAIPIPAIESDRHAQLARMLQNPNTTDDTIAEYIVQECLNDRDLNDFLRSAFQAVQNRQIIPLYLYTMVELNLAQNASNLAQVQGAKYILGLDEADERTVIKNLWQLADGLSAANRWAYAVVLLSAIARCCNHSAVGVIHSNQANLISAEAKLLQQMNGKSSQLIEQIKNGVNTEYGLQDRRKEISQRVLKIS